MEKQKITVEEAKTFLAGLKPDVKIEGRKRHVYWSADRGNYSEVVAYGSYNRGYDDHKIDIDFVTVFEGPEAKEILDHFGF